MAKTNEESLNNFNIIATGSKIIGKFEANGDVRIDGFLEGSFISNAKLVLGKTGQIKGEIKCKEAELFGEANGKITVEELLFLRSTTKVKGDIITQKLAIEPGATFTGNCIMDSDLIKNDEITEK